MVTRLVPIVALLLTETVVLTVTTCAQPSVRERGEVLRLYRLAQERERRAENHTWVWEYSVSVWFTGSMQPAQNQYLPPKNSFHQRGMLITICKQNGRVVVSAHLPSLTPPPDVISRLPNLLVAPSKPVSSVSSILRVYMGNIGIAYEVPPPPPPLPSNVAPPPLPPLPIMVWRCDSECRRWRDLARVTELVVLLSMDNPLGIYRCNWNTIAMDNETVTISCSSPSCWRRVVVQVSLDKRTGLLRDYVVFAGSTTPHLSGQVVKYARREDMVVPSEVVVKRVMRYGTDWQHVLYRYSLRSVSKTGRCDFRLPTGSPTIDYRLVDECISPWTLGEPHIERQAVNYDWPGYLPDEKELKSMAYKQGKLPSAGKGLRATWVLFLPGLLLFVLAWYLYRRMRESV